MSLLTRPAGAGVRSPFVMVGGVPGAGKSTALAAVAARLPGARLLDSDDERRLLQDLAPPVPYAVLRPLVHLIHQLRMVWALLRGPGGYAGLVVHDPSTRWFRLAIVGRVAAARGWEPRLLFVDASRSEALRGQAGRGRVVTRRTFRKHWARWGVLRGLLVGDPDRLPARWAFALAPWPTIRLASRPDAVAALERLAGTRRPIQAGVRPRCTPQLLPRPSTWQQ